MSNITIEKQGIKVVSKRKELIEISETHDGVVFNFKYGLHLYVTDPNMQLSTKQLLTTATRNFPEGTIKVDLNDYQHPAKVEF
jgi:hypothetical protein